MIIEVCCFPFLRYYNSYPSQVDSQLLEWMLADSDNDDTFLSLTGFIDNSDLTIQITDADGPLPPELVYTNASLADLG